MLFSLAACGAGAGGPDVTVTPPEGMQIAEIGDGYTFFAPEDWRVDRSTGIVTAYVSTVDPSNITLVRLPDGDAVAYFEEAEDKLSKALTDYTLHEAEDNALMGGKPAIVRVFGGTLLGVKYRYKQYLCRFGGYLYLLTYTAKEEIPSGEVTYYDRYAELADKVATAFLFEGSAAAEPEEPPREPVRNEKGNLLISDPAVSGYALYAPEDWTPYLQNGTTSAMRDGLATVSVVREIPNENTVDEYWDAKEAAMRLLYADFDLIESECSLPAESEEEVTVRLDGHQAARYVYTYSHDGITYKAIRLITLDGLYVLNLTYTARLTPLTGGAVPFNDYRLEFLTMIEEFRFQ